MTEQDSSRAKVPNRPMNADIACRAAAAAAEKAKEFGEQVSVAVVDESGNLVYFLRGDSCSFITFETAKGKAAMAAGFRRPTKDFIDAARENPTFWIGAGERLGMIVGSGGYPLTRDGALIGAIGCGGATGEQDHLCSEAGSKAVSS